MKKCFLFLLLSVLISITAKAQTFYEVKYYDKVDKQKYLGLMTYWDNEQCTLRCVRDNNTDYYWECAYQCDFQKQGRTNFMIFSPVPERGKENLSYPYFVWNWTKKDASDQSESPYVVFDLSEVGESMRTAEYFEEISLSDMDAEYVGQFYDEDEEMYGIITGACNIVNQQGTVSDVGMLEGEDYDGYDNEENVREDKKEDVEETVTDNNGPVTMHFIMAAATKDASIGESVETDLKLAEPEFKRFAKQLNINYQERIISGNSFTKENILNAIKGVKAAPNDVIVFFYSGHGFRFDDDKDDYPNMFLTYSNYGISSSNDYLGVSEAYNMLAKKKARLTIVLSDCCNAYYGATRQEIESSALASRGNNSYDLKKLEKLFLYSSGTLKVTAAKAGQVALCDARGGYLLTAFLNNIHSQISAVSDKDPSWEKIVDNAREYVRRKTTGFDETGEDRDPQIVVRSISIKETAPAVTDSNRPGKPNSLKSDNDNRGNDYDDSGSVSSDDEDLTLTDVLIFGCVCVLLPILVLVWLLKKIFGKKKQN